MILTKINWLILDLSDPVFLCFLLKVPAPSRYSSFFGFLLWQSAYAEYEFIDTLWPDFNPDIFEHVLRNYGKRERRFGAVIA